MKVPLLFLLLSLALGAADVTGKWVLRVELDVGSGNATFDFKQEGENLTGRYSGRLGKADVTGKVKGDDIDFTFHAKGDIGEMTVTYTGKVTGNSMTGKVKYGSAASGTFSGKRAN